MYKLNEKQIEVLKAKGLYEGFFDKLKKAVKDITDSDLKKIAKKRDKKVRLHDWKMRKKQKSIQYI